MRAVFRPEFLNRIDEIILFEPLGRSQLDSIVHIQVAHYSNLLADRELKLVLSDKAAALLAERGYDPVYGARPLKRSIQRHLIDPLANEILAGRFPAGTTIRADASGDRIVFDMVGAETEAA